MSPLYLLAANGKNAAARTVQMLVNIPNKLSINPRIGERLEEFEPREVRHIHVGHYEMRYEVQTIGYLYPAFMTFP